MGFALSVRIASEHALWAGDTPPRAFGPSDEGNCISAKYLQESLDEVQSGSRWLVSPELDYLRRFESTPAIICSSPPFRMNK